MKKLISIYLVSIAMSLTAQEEINFTGLGSSHYSDVEVFEKELNSSFKTKTFFNPHNSEYFDDLVLNVKSEAHIFQRIDKSFFPNLSVWYFLSEDSIVFGHYYKWGFYNPDFNPSQNLDLLKAQTKRLKEYRQQYEKIKANLITILGGDFEEIIVTRSKFRYYEYSVWDKMNSRTVLEIVFDPTLTEMPGFISGGDSHITIKTFKK